MKQKKYWVIRWNATVIGQKRSSRMFQTFLDRPELFETYGYHSDIDVRRFAKVNKGDQIFCFQSDCYKSSEGTYIALGEVKVIESKAPGGLCLVLLAKYLPLQCGETKFRGRNTLYELKGTKAKALCERCGVEWHGPPTN